MSQPIKILIVGNGFGGVYALKNLHKFFHKNPKVEMTLVGEKNYFLFTPLLHEVATGGINLENIIEPIRKVLGCCLHNFYLGKAEFINLAEQTVQVGNISLAYDYLVLAPGAQTNFYGTPGAEKYSLPLKSIEDAMKMKNHCVRQMERAAHIANRAERQKILRWVVVGGGPTGVELAAELQELIQENFSHYYPKEVVADASVVLIQKDSELVPAFGAKVRKKSLQVLNKKGIKVVLGRKVQEVGPAHVLLDDNTSILTETVLWVAGVKPADLKFNEMVEKSGQDRLLVNEYLQIKNQEKVFALGDAAAFKSKDFDTYVPGLAQVAEKEARAVAKNIQLLIKNKKLKPFVYHHSGDLLSLGRWMAIGEIFNWTFSGRLTWWVWRTVYLSKLISWRKKIKVAVDWTMNISSARDISEL